MSDQIIGVLLSSTFLAAAIGAATKLIIDAFTKRHEVKMETRRKDNQLALDLFKAKVGMIPDAIPTLTKLGSVLYSFSRSINSIIKARLDNHKDDKIIQDMTTYCMYLLCRFHSLDKMIKDNGFSFVLTSSEGEMKLTQIIESIRDILEKSETLTLEDISIMIKLGNEFTEYYKFLEETKKEEYTALKSSFLQLLNKINQNTAEAISDYGKQYKQFVKCETSYMFIDWYGDVSSKLYEKGKQRENHCIVRLM